MMHLLQNNYGASGIVPSHLFLGIVEDRNDPLQIGRVRVRIFGIHPNSIDTVPTEGLPWATPIQPITSAANQGVGDSPLGIQIGSLVVGFFLDGELAQQPILLGSIAGAPGGLSELPISALGDSSELTVKRNLSDIEPPSEYAAQYPYNRVLRSESGHILELDDTPGAERIHLLHTSGTYLEVGPTGQKVDKVVEDSYKIVKGTDWAYIEGDATVYVKGNITVYAYNDCNINVAGDYNVNATGAIRLKADKINLESGSNIDMIASDNVNIDGSKVYIASGLASKTGLKPLDFAEFNVVSPTIVERPQMELDGTDNDADRQNAVSKLGDIVSDKQLEPEEEKEYSLDEKEINVGICTITETQANNPSFQISKYFTIADFTVKPKYSHRLKAQRNLTKSQIVCNLQALAVNCLDPLRDYSRSIGGGGLLFTSGFRSEEDPFSRHQLGQCADVRFSNYVGAPDQETYDFYFEMAEWCIKNIPFDQVILEVLTSGTRLPWIHIGFDREGNRSNYFTYVNHANRSGGGNKLIRLKAPN